MKDNEYKVSVFEIIPQKPKSFQFCLRMNRTFAFALISVAFVYFVSVQNTWNVNLQPSNVQL